MTTARADTYTITPARYAKGKLAVSCPGIECSMGTIKSRAARLASTLAGNSYSNREKAYIMSEAAVKRFAKLYAGGYDADVMTREILKPECAVCGDHHAEDERPFTCETGDGI